MKPKRQRETQEHSCFLFCSALDRIEGPNIAVAETSSIICQMWSVNMSLAII